MCYSARIEHDYRKYQLTYGADISIAAFAKLFVDLKREVWQPQDSRIFPGMYAPVLVSEGGRRVLRPMRNQCRPEGKPAF